ncbi:MAG: DUF1385 domain-containing protein [Ruminococcus sp.]|nr:DUF1385 domain-containing protein [Ruminococcus sp.]
MSSKQTQSKEKFKSKIGGQAVIEGVMMRGIDRAAMACRLPNGEIDLEKWGIRGGKNAPFYRKIPFVRGVFVFISSMIDGYKCLSRSADKQMTDDGDEEQTKFEKWVDEKLGDKLMPVITTISIILGLGLAIALFMLLPSGLSKLIDRYIVELPATVKNIIEGLLKIAVFVGYTSLTALMKDIRRTYEYHGAEHKTITCYEHGDELTPENVKKHCRFHPRCGTSFIFLVLFISIFVNTVFQVSWGNLLVRTLIKLCLLPVVMGISYEVIRLAGKYDNPLTRVVSAPGLWIQRITTREPDTSEIECAIKALEACIPDDPQEDRL